MSRFFLKIPIEYKYIYDEKRKAYNLKVIRILSIVTLLVQIYFFINSMFKPFSSSSTIMYRYYLFYKVAIAMNFTFLLFLLFSERKMGLNSRLTTFFMCLTLVAVYFWGAGVAIADMFENENIVVYYLVMFIVVCFIHINILELGIIMMFFHILISYSLYMVADYIGDPTNVVMSNFQFIFFSVLIKYYLEELYKKTFMQQQIIEMKNKELERLSFYDSLSGLENRRRWEENYHKMYKTCKQNQEKMAVLIMDIDYFKQYNDFYGHTEGDNVIREIADTLISCCSIYVGHIGRYGGDEFVFVYSGNFDTNDLIQSIQKNLSEKKIIHEKSLISDYVTLSCGNYQDIPNDREHPWSYVVKADERLYIIKRNREEKNK